jgi:hypothetical protein
MADDKATQGLYRPAPSASLATLVFCARPVSYIADVEAEPAQHPGSAVNTTAEIVRAEWNAGRELESNAGDRFRIVAATV